MEDKYTDAARIFKAFCDENRLKILELLGTGEKCACTLLSELAIVQSTLSHHMKILTDSGIVSGRREGKWTYYALREEGILEAQEAFNTFTDKAEIYVASPGCRIQA